MSRSRGHWLESLLPSTAARWLALVVTPDELQQVFHDRTRAPIGTGTADRPLELDGRIRRHYDLDPGGRFAMIESPDGLSDDPASFDSVIAAQRDFFAARGQRVEWKTYDYDEPNDLADRLVAAGFVAEEVEALMVGEAGPLAEQQVALPDGIQVRPADGPDDFVRIRALQEQVWGHEQAWVTESLLPEWLIRRSTMDVVVVEESREGPVLCAARGEYDDSPFTGLWGGSTLEAWRGRGLYRATLAHRARLGLERGNDYVRIDASPDSEPILRRLGLHRVATTTPYIFDPAN